MIKTFATDGASTVIIKAVSKDNSMIHATLASISFNISRTPGAIYTLPRRMESGKKTINGSFEIVECFEESDKIFDITVEAVNNEGDKAFMKLYDVEITELQDENRATFIAKSISPWTKIGE